MINNKFKSFIIIVLIVVLGVSSFSVSFAADSNIAADVNFTNEVVPAEHATSLEEELTLENESEKVLESANDNHTTISEAQEELPVNTDIRLDFKSESIIGLDPTASYEYKVDANTGAYTAIPIGSESFNITSVISTAQKTLYIREVGTQPEDAIGIVIPVRPDRPSTKLVKFEFPGPGEVLMKASTDLEFTFNSSDQVWTPCALEGDVIDGFEADTSYDDKSVYIRLKATDESFASLYTYRSIFMPSNTYTYDASLRRVNYGLSLSYPYYSVNGGEWILAEKYSTFLDVSPFLSSTQPTIIRFKFMYDHDGSAYRELILPQIDGGPEGISIDYKNEKLVGLDTDIQYQYCFTENGTYINIPKGDSFSINGMISTTPKTIYIRSAGSAPTKIDIPVRPARPAYATFSATAPAELVMNYEPNIEYSYASDYTIPWTECPIDGTKVDFTYIGQGRYINTRIKATDTAFASEYRSNYAYSFPKLTYDASIRRVTYNSVSAQYSVNGGEWQNAANLGYLDVAELLNTESPVTIKFMTGDLDKCAYQEITLPKLDTALGDIKIDYISEMITGLDADKQYQYSFNDKTYTNIPKASTFNITSLITSEERTMYIRNTDSTTTAIKIPARPAAPTYELLTPTAGTATLTLEAGSVYTLDVKTGEYTDYPQNGIDLTWSQAENVVGTRNVFFKKPATETTFESIIGGGAFYRMPNTLYFNTTNGRLQFAQNSSITTSSAWFSVDGGDWISNSASTQYIDITPYQKISPDTAKIRVKYAANSAYQEITVPSLQQWPSTIVVDYDKEQLTGLYSSYAYYYRLDGETAWNSIPSGSTSFSISKLFSTKDRVLQLRIGKNDTIPYGILLERKIPAPAKPSIKFPQAGKALIDVNSDYEYKYSEDTNWRQSPNEGIDVEWTNDPQKLGSRSLQVRLKRTDTTPPSETVYLSVNRMADITYDGKDGVVYFGGTEVNQPTSSINDGPWQVLEQSYATSITINKGMFSSTEENSIKIKYGNADVCAYAEVVVQPEAGMGVAGMPELIYTVPSDVGNPDAYNPFTGTFTEYTNSAYFKFEVNHENENAGFVVLDDQASVGMEVRFFDLSGNRILMQNVESTPAGYFYKIPDTVQDGLYFARIIPANEHLGFATTNFKAIYTDMNNVGMLRFGETLATSLERHDPNAKRHYAEATIKSAADEHWYKVFFTKEGKLPNAVTLTSDVSRIDFTIRSVEAPDYALYSSKADAKSYRTSFKSSFKHLVKNNWTPPETGYYYVVVKAEGSVTNSEPYRLSVGNPRLLSDTYTITGSSMTISRAGLTFGQTLYASASSIPKSAYTTKSTFNLSGNSSNGYATIVLSKSTDESTNERYYYRSGQEDFMTQLRGSWYYTAKISNSYYVPKTFTPAVSVTYWYELGD